MKTSTIVAYTHNADIVCRYCARAWAATLVEANGRNSEFIGVEDLLNILAGMEGIEREDETTFDSDDFPKVVFADQVGTDDSCGQCHEFILI